MAKAPLNDDAFDRIEYERAERQFRLAERELPPQAVSDLAREVVRR